MAMADDGLGQKWVLVIGDVEIGVQRVCDRDRPADLLKGNRDVENLKLVGCAGKTVGLIELQPRGGRARKQFDLVQAAVILQEEIELFFKWKLSMIKYTGCEYNYFYLKSVVTSGSPQLSWAIKSLLAPK